MTEIDETIRLFTFLDTLASQVIARNSLLRFAVALTQPECEAAYRLRYEEVIERGWGNPEDFPDGMEHDQYDDQAVQILVWDSGTLAATARLVFPVADEPLPVEQSFQIVVQPHKQVVYLSRIVIAPFYRGQTGHDLLLGVLSKSWQEIRARGYEQLCGVFSDAVMPLFQHLGIEVVPLAAPREFLGEMRQPCSIDMLATARNMSAMQGFKAVLPPDM